MKPNMTFDSDYWHRLYQQSQQATLTTGPLAELRMNNDLRSNALIHSATAPWVGSPAAGIRRIILERDGGEKTTRATSLVAYQAGSHFAAHIHPKGEEILVLSGVFSDESGHYPAGSYLRNPPGSAHAPFSDPGCMIFVKLQQFSPQDTTQLAWQLRPPGATLPSELMTRQVLFERPGERVELIQFAQATSLPADLGLQGFELLVLKGELSESRACYPVGTWLRCAPAQGSRLRAEAGTEVYLKSGHLGGIA